MNSLPKNPFPGLRPFQKDESHLFFGRENHIKEILRKLDAFHFVSIVGNSGSGKSSLVRAGILPRLENEGHSEWVICTMRPGKDPVGELAEVLNKVFGNGQPVSSDESQEVLRKSRLGLVQVIRPLLSQGKKLLLLIDQFEELFRYQNLREHDPGNDAQHFVDLLLGGVGQKEVPVYVMMTIRSDFLGDCEQFTGLPEAINEGQFLIPRMNREELQRSITGPVDLVGGKISPQLVHQLLNEVGNSPDQLPALQHVLMRSWEVWESEGNPARPIDIETYHKTGGISKALSNHAEEAFSELQSTGKQKLAEKIFRALTLKGADNRGIRRPTSLNAIAKITDSTIEEIIEVADVFRRQDRGFIMPPSSVPISENSVLDISHESLMRVWERLGNWVEEEADSAEIYLRLCESAVLYEKNMAGLWRDPDLQIAIDWKQENNPNQYWASQYNSNFQLAMRFLDASIQDKKFLQDEKRRRRNLTRGVVFTFILLLTLLSTWAFFERNQSMASAELANKEKENARTQESIARDQRLVAEEKSRQAEKEKVNAENERMNAEKQRKLADQNAAEARLQKLVAERASLSADQARRAAELDKKIAELQRTISDSLKTVAMVSEKNAYRLRVLSIAQALAVKSSQAVKGTYSQDVKPLIALQAYKFNKAYSGKTFDPDILEALYSSVRFLQQKNDFLHTQHSDAVKSIDFSPDGKYIASVGFDGRLILASSNAMANEKIRFVQQPMLYENVRFSETGQHICVVSENQVLVFNTGQPETKPLIIKNLHAEKILGLDVEQENMITVSGDQTIVWTEAQTGKVIKRLSLPAKPSCLRVSKILQKVYVGCEDGSILVIGLTDKVLKDSRKSVVSSRISALDISPDGHNLILGTSGGQMALIDMAGSSWTPAGIQAHSSGITGLRFDPSGKVLASSSLDQTVKLWNFRHSDEQPLVFKEHDSWVYGLAFNPKGNLLASCGKDRTVRLYFLDPEEMASFIGSIVKRNLTLAEWNRFIGADIPFEKTIGQF